MANFITRLRQVLFATADDKVGIGTVSPEEKVHVIGGNVLFEREFALAAYFRAYRNAAGQIELISNYARGTKDTPVIVNNNDLIFRLLARGHDGSGWESAAMIDFEIDGTPSDGTDMPGRIVFKTSPNGSSTPLEAMRITSDRKVLVNEKVGMTPLGGVVIRLTNKTGVASVVGKLVKADTATDDAFILSGADETETIGIVYEAGIADGAECWIVITGIADVLMKDNTLAAHGNWVKASDEAGYADATNAAPPGGGVAQLDEHMQEVGHCIESVAAGGGGTHILARCKIHFN